MEEHDHGQSPGEELANSISHGVGLVATFVAGPVLIASAIRHGGLGTIVGASIFVSTAVLLYLFSALYHALRHAKAKRVFQVLDHSAIFLLIAGTYTPFTLGVLHGTWGWALLWTIWTLAAAGVALTAWGKLHNRVASTALYVAMGWLMLVAVRPLWLRMPPMGFLWLGLGGVAYTAGVPFFAAHRRYSHFVWHLFVIAGTVCHFVAVMKYAAS
ncbi:MAG: hemolysin D [Gemmatimonadetes bacterium 13_1_40CM_2_70_7]|nr:MAG: hemolysin D [Gemmatimonadetes bacterium 13_1_40CM_2_70_7]